MGAFVIPKNKAKLQFLGKRSGNNKSDDFSSEKFEQRVVCHDEVV